MVSVKLVSKSSGKPIQGEGVSIGFSGLTRGVSSTEYTNSNGEAHFNVDPGEGKVYVRGSAVKRGYLSGMVVVYI